MDRARRKLVASGGAALVGAVGVGGANLAGVHRIGTAAVADLDGKTPAPGQVMTIEWSSPDIDFLGDSGVGLGVTRTGVGLLDQGGHVYITQTITDADVTDGSVDRLERHLFAVPDGQIMGMGSVTGGVGTFAVVGGTGRFAKTAGEYSTTYEEPLADGAGPAQFTFVLRGTD